MTYSIVARDPDTGALGVAVQSAMFGAGAIVPWARAGVGAVATQAIVEIAYGPRCLDAMGSGSAATEALATATAVDPMCVLRQVGVISADGTVAAYTGDSCVEHAGHVVGDGFSVQANMMASPEVWPAMAEAYRSARGSFARRLLAALNAGQRAGGDARGSMAAGLLIVSGVRAEPWSGVLTSLRVDRSDDPLGELARLIDSAAAYDLLNEAVAALFRGENDRSLGLVDEALRALPGEENFRFLRACALLGRGDIAGARTEIHALVKGRPTWAIVIRSFVEKGLLPLPPAATVEALLGG